MIIRIQALCPDHVLGICHNTFTTGPVNLNEFVAKSAVAKITARC